MVACQSPRDRVVVAGGIFREVFVEGQQSSSRIGGSGLTAAIAASRLGSEAVLVATVGGDDADEALALLQQAGVNTEWVSVVPGASGIFAFEDVADASAPRPLFRPAESVPVDPHDAPQAAVNLAFGMPQADPLSWLHDSKQATLIWDRQGWLSQARGSEGARHRPEHRRVFVANWSEFLDEFGPDLAGEMLAGAGVPGFETTIIKAGPWGVTVIDAGVRHAVPTVYVETNNVIGSGDTFAGALAAGLAGGKSPTNAALQAGAAAAVALEAGTGSLSADGPTAVAEALAGASRGYVDPAELAQVTVGFDQTNGPGGDLLVRLARGVVEHLGLQAVQDPDQAEIRLCLDDSMGDLRSRLIDAVRERMAVVDLPGER